MTIQFQVTAKLGVETKAVVLGRVLPDEEVSLADVNKVIEVEQWLERITGLRWHIEMRS